MSPLEYAGRTWSVFRVCDPGGGVKRAGLYHGSGRYYRVLALAPQNVVPRVELTAYRAHHLVASAIIPLDATLEGLLADPDALPVLLDYLSDHPEAGSVVRAALD